MFRNRFALVAVTLVAVVALVAGCSGSTAGPKKVVVGSKDFTENILMGEMVAQLIEGNTDIKVERKLNLGGTKVNFDGIRNGDLDMYLDYDGTAYSVHLKIKDPITDPDAVYPRVKQEFEDKFDLTWSKPLGFNNTYAIAMPRKLAEQYQIKTISDLAKYPSQFVFGTTNEFMGRTVDGFYPFTKTYGIKFKDVKKMEAGLRYNAIKKDAIQVMDAYATDGKLKEFDMMILKDDKKFFPPYNAAYVIRMDTLKKYPGLLDVVNKLSGQLNDQTMQELNWRVDAKGETVEAVAKDFLKSKGLLK